MPRIYIEEDLSLIQLDDDFTLEGIHIDSNVVYSGSKNSTLKLSKFQGNAKFRIYNNSKFLLTIQPNVADQINKIGILSNSYVLKSGDRIDIVYDYDVKQWIVFGQWVDVGGGGAVRSLKRIATNPQTIFCQLENGTYLGTDGTAAGGFGGAQIWYGTGDPASISNRQGITQTNTASLKDAAGNLLGSAALVRHVWPLPTGDFIFEVLSSSVRSYLYYAKSTGANTWTVGANSPAFDDGKTVLELGKLGGTHTPNIRGLHQRSLCVADISGSRVLLFGEYNVASGRVSGSTNDQVRVWRSNDDGKTWSILLTFNTNGTTTQVRHCHGIVQDPITKRIYFLFGDDPNSAIIIWDGVASAPPANTSFANYDNYAGWWGKYDQTNPDKYRTCDLLFGGNSASWLIDRGVLLNDVLNKAYTLNRFGSPGVMSSVASVEVFAGRDPVIGIATPDGGGYWFSLWDTTSGTNPVGDRGYDVWHSPDLVNWTKIGTIPDVSSTANTAVLTNVFFNKNGQLIVSLMSGAARLIATGNTGGTIVFDYDSFDGQKLL